MKNENDKQFLLVLIENLFLYVRKTADILSGLR
jgi:hypothetical protein